MRSSSAKISSSAAWSITSVRSPPSPRPTTTARDRVVGCSASIAWIPATIRSHAASHSGAVARATMRPYPRCMASVLDGLTDAQRDAVTHTGGPLLVIGGAGTGKTEVLVRRLVWLADEGTPPHRILVLSAQEDLSPRLEAALERPHEDLALHTA